VFIGSLFSIHDQIFALLMVVIVVFAIWKIRTRWFCYKFIRYTFLGIFLSLVAHLMRGSFEIESFKLSFDLLLSAWTNIEKKGFFVIAFIGIAIFIFNLFNQLVMKRIENSAERVKYYYLLVLVSIFAILAMIYPFNMAKGLTLLWLLTFFSIYPIEKLFGVMSKYRSKRNLVYLCYIILAILDSRLESRIKSLISFVSR
jgi:hypothetical protein